MGTEPLLKTFPVLQTQMDALLEFDSSPDDIHRNSLMRFGFSLLFRDLIRLFATYNDAVINLLEKYFTMNKKCAKDALDYYKKFLTRMDKVSEFLKVKCSTLFLLRLRELMQVKMMNVCYPWLKHALLKRTF